MNKNMTLSTNIVELCKRTMLSLSLSQNCIFLINVNQNIYKKNTKKANVKTTPLKFGGVGARARKRVGFLMESMLWPWSGPGGG